ncbi:rab11 family-interacting protein 3-like [Elephas maximus indicus]|uniref:rab11 family-interacting protein 3-like n=1 Tax=Elephas maximus indicus TaxID=99487 RepID=UPI002115F5F2|nr:rab11 family-interacting protein 3-like [Elephas maximus indicus]
MATQSTGAALLPLGLPPGGGRWRALVGPEARCRHVHRPRGRRSAPLPGLPRGRPRCPPAPVPKPRADSPRARIPTRHPPSRTAQSCCHASCPETSASTSVKSQCITIT